MRAGLHGLGLEPAVFWRLTPVELRMMLGAEQAAPPLTRARWRNSPPLSRTDRKGGRTMENVEVLADQLAALDERSGASAAMAAAFDGELARMRETMVFTGREMNTLSSGLRRRLAAGLRWCGLRWHKLQDALKGLGKTIADTVYGIAIKR